MKNPEGCSEDNLMNPFSKKIVNGQKFRRLGLSNKLDNRIQKQTTSKHSKATPNSTENKLPTWFWKLTTIFCNYSQTLLGVIDD